MGQCAQAAFVDIQRGRLRARHVQCLALLGGAGPHIVTLGKPLVLAVGWQAAKIGVAANFQHLHSAVDQADHRQKTFMVKRVGQQPFRCVVRRYQ
ncbi:hypothetical protein D3C81_1967900 [compost metagenome]